MRKLMSALVLALALGVSAASSARAADEYALDAMHAAVQFKVSHLGLSWTYGRFNDLSGSFTLDPDPTKSTFALTIKTQSIDTSNAKRDEHLRSPDFFNVKQYPAITFKSTAARAVKDGYEVTGDLTMHGVTKPVTFSLLGGRKAEFPKGVQRTGFTAEVVLKRTAFGMNKMTEAIGDDIHVSISFEGTKK